MTDETRHHTARVVVALLVAGTDTERRDALRLAAADCTYETLQTIVALAGMVVDLFAELELRQDDSYRGRTFQYFNRYQWLADQVDTLNKGTT